MKRFTCIFTAGLLVFSLTACAENPENTQPAETPAQETNTPEPESTSVSAEDTLVIYTSATGTTKDVAEHIAEVTGADVYEIKAADPYTDEDLNWHDSNSRTTHEQNDPSVRPEITGEDISLQGYSTVYIGYPIWWGEEPRIMDTFAESHNFEGITVIPFCTSGSSGIGNSGKNLEENAGSGTWLEGRRFDGGVSASEIETWIDSLK